QDSAQVLTDSVQPPLPEGPWRSPVISIREASTPPGPLPPGMRHTFTRDSVLWSSALTLGDLLGQIPGVYIARGGFLGQPEYLQYGGRGGAALEIYWDGVPMEPLGGDTLFLDPGRIALSYLRRIDVEVLPASLRIYLVSERHEGLDPRSVVCITSGSFSTGAYAGLFQNRWPQGTSIDIAADFAGTDGASGENRSDQTFDIWAKVGWMPSERFGAIYQMRRQRHDRDPVSNNGQIGVPERAGARTDFSFDLFAGSRPNGLGIRADGGAAVSSWSADSGTGLSDQSIRQAHVGLRYMHPRWTAAIHTRVADARTPFSLEAQVGVVPLPGFVLSGMGRWRRHDADRESRSVYGSAGLYRGPVSLVGTVALQKAVQAPVMLDDSAVSTADRSLIGGLNTRRLTGHVGVVHRDAYQPLPYPDLPALPAMSASPATTYLVADAQLRLSSVVTVSGWYSDPLSDSLASLQPPKHGRAEITLRSKYWRTFRSGAFDLKVRWAMESWSTGIAGLDAVGAPVELPGATFFEAHVEFQVVGFTAYWNLRNARLTDAVYVPGLDYPKNAQTFGVTWEFRN
ncbi:MAG: Plug domain-containing protein, partial [Acidimicrobiia bacterium]